MLIHFEARYNLWYSLSTSPFDGRSMRSPSFAFFWFSSMIELQPQG